MMTKESLMLDLEKMGIKRQGTLLVHSSYKSIGPVEGGPNTVLDALSEYMAEGLLVLPTHTWSTINSENPRFYVKDSPTCVGILTEWFRQRPGVVRSLHPTHSVAALGRDAESFVAGDEQSETPCGYQTAWRRLLERQATILLLGVDLRRNTFIHGVEEWANVPGRLTEHYEELITVLPDGTEIPVPSRRHSVGGLSQNYWKVNDLFIQKGAMYTGRFGLAETRVCDTVKMTQLLTDMLARTPELFSNADPLPRSKE
ncbi:AAC(3) family N-acetyltransferase [Paenibacillus sp. GD4]|uniref:AAC(3) family N-acetyltransferase n=1 Tax=Paenibacillus sp. GD4 TaxID=3068890 RepID=UPI0027969743|nr:AAC(3) family N-acetyltransferase [Paenibacillus sp. GD4]MDQ1909640.1 AAC(3) family N-acetyltransferase [Paenibacillus sp. GD4]